MENSNKILIAAGAGLAVGALAGVLFAPAKGADTRTAIKDKAVAIKDKVTSVNPMEALASLKSKVEDKFTDGKEDVKEELIAQIHELEDAIENA